MLYVPQGAFTMGSDADAALLECQKYRTDCQRDWFVAEEPVHTVTLDAFWIDQTEVTNGKYAKCEQAGACKPPSQNKSYARDSYYGNSDYAEYPVIYVDWDQAKAYCAWAGARLPSEAEWEKAARGTDGRTYPWGEGIDKSYANYGGDVGDTTRVGTYESGKSPYGALDMAGNVWEWVNDWYKAYPGNTVADSSFGETYQVLRGGSWGDVDFSTRSADRLGLTPDVTSDDLGFRCVRSP